MTFSQVVFLVSGIWLFAWAVVFSVKLWRGELDE